MKRRTLLSLGAAGFIGPALSQAQEAAAKDTVKRSLLDAELQALVNHPHKPLASLSALAIRDGAVVYEGHFGYRRIDNVYSHNNVAPDSATLYRMASISKLVTTIGAMRLVDAGRLDLDADVSRYLGFTLRNPHFADRPITTRMLLSHTASLRDDAGYFFALDVPLRTVLGPGADTQMQTKAWAAPSTESERAPGHYFSYCNLNFGIVGTVIEAISQQRFDLYMQAQVLQPLGLAGGFTPETLSQNDVENLAVLYRKRNNNEVWEPQGPWVPQTDDFKGQRPAPRAGLSSYVIGSNATGFGPQGGLRISVGGLGRLMQMLMQQGSLDGVRVLSPASVQAMMQEHWYHRPERNNGDTSDGLFQSWGLGMQRFEDFAEAGRGDRIVAQGGAKGVGHLGDAYGLHSAFIFDPVTRNGMVYAIGGLGSDPEKDKGRYSSFQSWEESTLDALHRLAIQQQR